MFAQRLTFDEESRVRSKYARLTHALISKTPPITCTKIVVPAQVEYWNNTLIGVSWLEKEESKIAYIASYGRSNLNDILFELKYSQRERKPIGLELVYPREDTLDDPIFIVSLSYKAIKKPLKSLASLAYIALIKQNNIYAPDIKVKILDRGTLTGYETV